MFHLIYQDRCRNWYLKALRPLISYQGQHSPDYSKNPGKTCTLKMKWLYLCNSQSHLWVSVHFGNRMARPTYSVTTTTRDNIGRYPWCWLTLLQTFSSHSKNPEFWIFQKNPRWHNRFKNLGIRLVIATNCSHFVSSFSRVETLSIRV